MSFYPNSDDCDVASYGGDDAPSRKRGRNAPRGRGQDFDLAAMADDSAAGMGGYAGGNGGSTKPPGEPVAWKKLRDEIDRCDTECWGCAEGVGSKAPAGNRLLAGLGRLVDQLRSGTGSRSFLYEQIATFHEKVTVPAKRALGEPCDPWPLEMIQVHFEAHVVDARAVIVDGQRTLQTLVAFLKNKTVRVVVGEEGREEEVAHTENIAHLLKCLAAQKSYAYGDATKLFR